MVSRASAGKLKQASYYAEQRDLEAEKEAASKIDAKKPVATKKNEKSDDKEKKNEKKEK